MAILAILFDLDGTLVDSNEAHIEAWQQAFDNEKIPLDHDKIRPEIGKGGDHLVKDLLGEDEDRRIGQKLRDAHDANFLRFAAKTKLKLFPGVIELLETLRRRTLKAAIVTSSGRKMVEKTFQSSGTDLTPFVDLIITSDDASRTKPSPDLAIAALTKLGLPPDACLFIGDTTHDCTAASRAGIPFIGLTCGGCASEQDLALAGAVCVWESPAEMLEKLEQTLAVAATVLPG